MVKKNWSESTIKQVSHNIQYGLTSRSGNDFNGPKYLRITDIQEGNVDWANVPNSEINTDIEKYTLNKDDIVFARTGATVGKSYLIKEIPEKSVFASYLIRIVADKSKALPQYIYYYFQSPMYWQKITKNQRGIGQPNVNGQILSQIKLPFPNKIDDQQQIVDEIETQFTRLDSAIQSLKTIRNKLELYRKSVLKAAFAGKLIKINGNIKRSKLGEEFSIIMGQSPPSKFYNNKGEGLPFLQGKKEFGKIYPKVEVWTTQGNKIADKDDILISVRAPVGDVNIAPVKCCIGRGLASIKSDSKVSSFLIYYLMKFIKNKLVQRSTGTTFSAITKNNLYNIEIILPEQKDDRNRLVSEIESRFSVIDKVEEVVDNALKKAERLRKSILKSAFEGRLVKEGV